MNNQDLREEVVRVSRRMSDSGLVMGTSGNVSARTPDGNVLVTPSGLDYVAMEPEDVVLVDLDGAVVEGSFAPSVETPMHTGIYRARPAGEPVTLTPEQIAEVAAKIHDYGRHKPSSSHTG